ncbi:PREDICTED: CASP8-associated protein 2 [Calidris pugnax]|uniref:CASP8-associated protein 2 n=1 Tax=Calidris pugnax TaxID=198806 RepID=UPI00071D1C91|nr:PREDICTED: CASP8-associated protein 2 [Calidris pugnax]XP_014820214.1 PREDICTED: CASP8-associated protein 2 [Calidris pugnax]
MATDEDGLGLFDIRYSAEASPFKEGDESSVDIYDGLDNGLTVPENSAPNSTPSGNSLNLFDEILIEEGTAKEASYNELQAEYGKCQQQIKELMKKFKEIQAQNVILQNENQALKKNISALIKTARVEINRKDEEISNLHQRLSEFPNHRNNFTRTYLPGSTNGRCSEMCKTKDSKFRPSDVGDSVKMEHRMKNDCSKDPYHSYSSHNTDNGKSSSEKRNTPYLLKYPPEELCNDGTHMCLPNYDHGSNKDNRKERKEIKNNEQYSRGNVNKHKREAHESTGNTGNNGDSEEGNSDPQQKLKTFSEKAGKNESQQKSQSVKLKCSPSAERRAERGVSSWEKQPTGKDRFQTRGELYADERSQNLFKKDVKAHDKDEKNTGQKSKPNEKLQEQPRRCGRGSSPHSKSEHSKSLHESRKCRVEESRKGRDTDCKRDRGTNDHTSREGRTSPSNSNSREHKYARLKENSSRYEWETAHSKSERHRTEEKRKRERDNQDENRHFRNERKIAKEFSHQSGKESKKGTDVTKSERNKSYKLEEVHRVADSLKEHKMPKTKDDHTGTKSKDLKLSFMEKLNLTLSPAKKQCLSPTDGLKTPSQKAADEGSAELTLQAELLGSAQPVQCGPEEQGPSTGPVLDSAAQSDAEPALPFSVNSGNEAFEVAAAANPAQSEELPAVATDELSSEASPEAEVGQVQPQALPVEGEVLVPEEMEGETLSEAAGACDLVESGASATAAAVTDLNRPESLPLDVAGSVAECENVPVAVGVTQDDSVPPAEVAQSEPADDSMGTLPESAAEKKEEDKVWLGADLGSSADRCGSQNLILDDSEANSSADVESCHVTDDISETKPDSLMEVVKDDNHLAAENVECPVEEKGICETNTSASQSLDRTVLTDKDEPLVDQNACDLEPDLTEVSTAASSLSGEMCPRTKERETNPVPVDDDSSILSIDLNHLRYIPKAISPLNSPMRPLAKALKMESPCKGLVKSYNKDLIPESTVVVCPSKNLSKEVNKENQKPVSMSDEHLEMESQLSISSDELEEGEIISSDEDEEKSKPERGSENAKKSGPKASPETRNLTSSPQNQKSKTVHCNEDNGKFVSVKVSTKKNREKHKNQTFRSSKDTKKNKTVSIACLEKIVHVVVEPSNVQEIMQMLRAIRKQMRKNYMKFKVHFPVQHFHRIIESGIINFTSLIKYLNFSKMSTIGETLKLNICDVIESKLKQVKKNAIVDSLFEQQVSDMKKQLWKFVDEQLDYLFEKIRRIIIKLCDVGNQSEEGKFERAGKQKHKISHKNDVQRSRKKSLKARSQKPEEYILSKQIVDYQRPKCHHEKNKTDAPKAAFTKCLNSIDNTRNSQTKVHLSKENNLQGALTPLKGVKYEKEGFQLSRDANKSDLSYELLTEQQASSLTFNLVSDAQMGEIFKSLLQGSDLLEKNGGNIDRNEWEFRTPEKQYLDSHKGRGNAAGLVQEIVPKEPCVESRPVEDINWPVVSPVRAPSLASRLQMSVDPDVLDESCMFEVPTNAASCKDDECSLQKNKSFVSSILLEDLAVSLTIPSPLKSDAHLSFLKPENNSSSTPEGVLSAHYSEDALLEEEDATEQDIHLALESDNSSSKSSCSSSWTSRPVAPGFQCRPSLPMQAVIMEKSNDHFIVKIRRAVPCASPASDQVASVKEARVSSAKMEKDEMRSGERERGGQSAPAATLQATVKTGGVKMDQLPYVGTGQEQNPALPQLLKESHNNIGKEEAGFLGPCRKSSNAESHDTESPGEGSEQSQAHKLKESENINETSVRSQASFPAGCSIESYIDLTDDISSETSCRAVESPADNRTRGTSTGNSEISDKKEELEECSDAFIDLTEEFSNETVAGESNLETKSTSNTDAGCQISIDDKTSKKRKKDTVRENSNSKRQRKETESAGEGSDASDVKSEEVNSAPKQCSSKKNELQQNKESSPLASSASSPSLYAKNIIKKKGEVVVSWTRNDDREILLECQRKGPSSKTFVSLATRLNKSPNQVAERFKQLMKLFKKSKCK